MLRRQDLSAGWAASVVGGGLVQTRGLVSRFDAGR